ISEIILLSLNTILVIPFPITILLFIIKPFSLGVSISSILYIYKIKGLLYLPIILPSIINLILISILFYYSITYIIVRLRYKNKTSRRKLLFGYIKIILIILVLNIVVSYIESYLSYYLFKYLK
ncbi:MAG: hypothetical protein Q4E69_05785, partial [Bacilli bacterium]|nr:hypothetical protein [Bacilli bacterium]